MAKTVDMTQYLKEGEKLALSDFLLGQMKEADTADRKHWEPVSPVLVQILKWPREEASASGILLSEGERKARNGGWVIGVGPECKIIRIGDQVTFLPLHFSPDVELTQKFRDNTTEIGYVVESEIDHVIREENVR